MKGVKKGFQAYVKAMDVMTKHGLMWVLIIPFVIQLLVLLIGYYASVSFVEALTDSVFSWTKELFELEKDSSWIQEVMFYTFYIGIRILYFFVYAMVGGYITLIILSPVMAYFSEVIEEHFSGRRFPFKFNLFIKNIIRGIIVVLRNFVIQMAITLVLLLVGLIPIIGFVSPFAIFFVSAYFYGFSFIDYYNERQNRTMGSSISFVRKNKILVTTIGSVFGIFLFIPFLGSFIAGFVSIFSVAAATIAGLEIDE